MQNHFAIKREEKLRDEKVNLAVTGICEGKNCLIYSCNKFVTSFSDFRIDVLLLY
jgi:hypothetical protein